MIEYIFYFICGYIIGTILAIIYKRYKNKKVISSIPLVKDSEYVSIPELPELTKSYILAYSCINHHIEKNTEYFSKTEKYLNEKILCRKCGEMCKPSLIRKEVNSRWDCEVSKCGVYAGPKYYFESYVHED